MSEPPDSESTLKQLPNEYSGPLAHLYEALHADDGDEEFWMQQIAKLPEGAKILELGCGTGRLLIPMAQAGYQVWGLDASKDMLEQCSQRVAELLEEVQSRVRLTRGNFDDFHFNERFDLIFFSCDTFQHLVGTDVQLACLRNIREHLADDGLFVCDQAIPDAETALEVDGEPQLYDFPESDEEGWRILLVPRVDFRMGRMTDLLKVSRVRYHESGEVETLESYRARADMALLFGREMLLLVQAAGMKTIETYGDYAGRAYSGEDDSLIIMAKRA